MLANDYPGAEKVISSNKNEVSIQIHKVHIGSTTKVPSLILMIKGPNKRIIMEKVNDSNLSNIYDN